jgi:hypothetical protein
MNPVVDQTHQWSGRSMEGAMIIQTLATIFIIAFVAIAALGHMLVLQAAFTPARPGSSAPEPGEQPSHHAPLTATRIAT